MKLGLEFLKTDADEVVVSGIYFYTYVQKNNRKRVF